MHGGHTPDAAASHAGRGALHDTVFERAPVAVAFTHGDECIVRRANPCFLRLVGQDRAVLGHPLLKALSPPAASPLPLLLQDVRERRRGLPLCEMSLHDFCGGSRDRHVRLDIEPLQDDGMPGTDLMIVAAEATLEVRARQALERAHEAHERLDAELRQAQRARRDFLAMLARELRSPLAPIVHALELVRLRGGAGAHGEEFAVIERQAQRMVELVDRLLSLSPPSQAQGFLAIPVEVARVLTHAAEEVSALMQRRHQRLQVSLPDERLQCLGEEERLVQMLGHLLHNASRFSPVGAVVELGAWEQAGEVVLQVRDRGIGLSPDLLPRIWSPFFQGAASLHEGDGGGLGMGLAMVKGLVALHRGTVSATSGGTGMGAEFVVHLPRAGAPRAPAPALGETPPLRILVVDDNEDAAHALGQLLQVLGHEVMTLTQPEEALAAADAFEPQLALLDIAMPQLDGFQLLQQLRGRPWAGGCRFVAVTAHGQDADRQRSLEAGFERHLVKPVMREALDQLLAPARHA